MIRTHDVGIDSLERQPLRYRNVNNIYVELSYI
jgi:hypothetical protein